MIIPTAQTGIFGAVLLAFGRALGETMALAMLVGNANVISWSLFSPANTLAALLANNFAEARQAPGGRADVCRAGADGDHVNRQHLRRSDPAAGIAGAERGLSMEELVVRNRAIEAAREAGKAFPPGELERSLRRPRTVAERSADGPGHRADAGGVGAAVLGGVHAPGPGHQQAVLGDLHLAAAGRSGGRGRFRQRPSGHADHGGDRRAGGSAVGDLGRRLPGGGRVPRPGWRRPCGSGPRC